MLHRKYSHRSPNLRRLAETVHADVAGIVTSLAMLAEAETEYPTLLTPDLHREINTGIKSRCKTSIAFLQEIDAALLSGFIFTNVAGEEQPDDAGAAAATDPIVHPAIQLLRIANRVEEQLKATRLTSYQRELIGQQRNLHLQIMSAVLELVEEGK